MAINKQLVLKIILLFGAGLLLFLALARGDIYAVSCVGCCKEVGGCCNDNCVPNSSCPNNFGCCCPSGCTGGDCGGDSGCTCSSPGTPTLSSPAINSTKLNIPVTLSWSGPSSWGNNCGQGSRHYEVYVSKNGGVNWFAPAGCINPTGTSCNASGLEYCTTYLWQVRANNGCSRGGFSSSRTFTTNCRSEVVSISASNTSCSDSWSGNPAYEGANNPGSFTAVFRDANGGNEIEKVYIALAPDEADNKGDSNGTDTNNCTAWERALSGTLGFYYDPQTKATRIVRDTSLEAPACP